MKCTNCGRFCKNVVAYKDEEGNIGKVEGVCSKCGLVDLTSGDWEFDDFQGDSGEGATK